MPQTTRHRSADVAVGYAADRTGRGIAYAAIATGGGRSLARIPFGAIPLPAHEGRELAYAALTAVGNHLRGAGFTRVRLRLADEAAVEEVNGRRPVAPALTMPYVKTRCTLHGFALARVERAEPIETSDLQTRARAELAGRAPAAA
ncbi:MAG TPA: hypothetical protein VGN14_12915 [Candidatus Elarobacter sp.]